MEMTTMTTTAAPAFALGLLRPQHASLRTVGAGRAFQGTGVPSLGAGASTDTRLALVAATVQTYAPITDVVPDVAFPSRGRPPV
ncbi:MAG TPA: hypothetical protein VFJ97_11945 [Dermatophilaceae bacterium]|nr:hypothetical protein [Dermatophilaceae bacterium]